MFVYEQDNDAKPSRSVCGTVIALLCRSTGSVKALGEILNTGATTGMCFPCHSLAWVFWLGGPPDSASLKRRKGCTASAAHPFPLGGDCWQRAATGHNACCDWTHSRSSPSFVLRCFAVACLAYFGLSLLWSFFA